MPCSLTLLLPYVSHVDSQFDRADGFGRLLKLLNSEHETRWPFDPLSIDFLRLEVSDGLEPQVFVANTFRHGLRFSSSQAIAWAVLELQADCTNEVGHIIRPSTRSNAFDSFILYPKLSIRQHLGHLGRIASE